MRALHHDGQKIEGGRDEKGAAMELCSFLFFTCKRERAQERSSGRGQQGCNGIVGGKEALFIGEEGERASCVRETGRKYCCSYVHACNGLKELT